MNWIFYYLYIWICYVQNVAGLYFGVVRMNWHFILVGSWKMKTIVFFFLSPQTDFNPWIKCCVWVQQLVRTLFYKPYLILSKCWFFFVFIGQCYRQLSWERPQNNVTDTYMSNLPCVTYIHIAYNSCTTLYRKKKFAILGHGIIL